MSEYQEDFTYRSTVTGKQEHKIKNHHHEEASKCFSPFVKLHHHNCPVAMTPCPVHGNLFHNTKKTKKNRKQDVIISFHPSSKTEKLLQPIKSLLANCRSDTKINFQYYSPSNSASRESLKSSPSLTTYENLKKTINNNVFVEKTKSFVADKTNKVKKLRQCFHSPCNSIAQKTRSHTSVQEKLNQILREEVKQTKNLYNMVPENPPDDKKSDPGLKWLYPNGLNLKNQVYEEPDRKRNSDYITVTQCNKNNIVNHKVFEIKHKKDLTDVPFVGFPKEQSQFVYSSIFGSAYTAESATHQQHDQTNQKQFSHADLTIQKSEKLGRNVDKVYSSRKSQRSTSSSSEYIIPFVFLPKATNNIENDRKIIKEEDLLSPNTKKQPPTSSAHSKQSVDQITQTSSTGRRSVIQTTSTFYTSDEEFKFISTSVQTDSYLIEKPPKHSTKSKMVSTYEHPQRALEQIDKSEVFIKRDYEIRKPKQNRRLNSDQTKRSVDVQAGCSCHQREVLITAKWGARDQTCQTEDSWNICLSVKTFESKSNKSEMTYSPSYSPKPKQTSPSPYSKDFVNCATPESIDRDYRNLSYVIKPLEGEESDQAMDKMMTWWKKSRSEGDLYTRTKSESTRVAENVHPSLSSDYESRSNETSETTKKPSFRTKETSTKDFPSAVSDLSELRRLIQEIFEKENFGSKLTCDCKTAKMREGKVDSGTMTENSFLIPEKKFVNAGVQTTNPKPERINVQAQTSVHVLLDEAQQKPGQKTFLRQSVTVDQLSATKTYYVCAMCGGEIKTLLRDVSTSTENASSDRSKRKEKTTLIESACTETVQVRMLKNCQCGANKNSLESREESQISVKQRNQEKSNVPLPSQTGSVKFKTNDNTSTIIQVETRGVNHRPVRLYNQEEVRGEANTSESHERSKGAKKQPTPDVNQFSSRTEGQEVQDSRSRRKNTDFIFPVFIKPFWTKELMQTWKSMENALTDYDSDNCSKSPISKQKRSYGKEEPTEIAAGKKIKVGFEGPSKEYATFDANSTSSKKENSIKKSLGVLWVPCSSSSRLKNESFARVRSTKLEKQINNTIGFENPTQTKRFSKNWPNNFFKIENSETESYYVQLWPKDMIPQESRTPEEESSISIDEIFDEEIPRKLPRENSLENEKEFHEECGHLSDSNYSPRTEGTNVFEDESVEFEAPLLEYYYRNPEVKLQSHTILTHDKSLPGNVNPTSRSLNTFYLDEDFKKKRTINNKKYEK